MRWVSEKMKNRFCHCFSPGTDSPEVGGASLPPLYLQTSNQQCMPAISVGNKGSPLRGRLQVALRVH
jgi:hypothetical protein